MAAPTSHNQNFKPYVLYRIDENGLVMDPDVRVDEISLGSGSNLHLAQCSINVGPVFSAIAGGGVVRNELTHGQLLAKYPPDQRFAVGSLADDPAEVEFLMHGYPDKHAIEINSQANSASYTERLVLRSLLARECRLKGRWLQGRWMLSKDAAEDLADSWYDLDSDSFVSPQMHWTRIIRHVAALPLIFNPEGKPNRLPAPVMLEYRGDPLALHIFTYENDPRAVHWTYLQALRYLWFFAMQESIVDAGNLFDSESPLTGGGISGQPAMWDMSEGDIDPAVEAPGFAAHMVRNCKSLTVEGKTIVEALAVLEEQAGLRYHELVTNDGGLPASKMHFWVPGDASADGELALERDGSATTEQGTPRDPAEVFSRNNQSSAHVRRDYAAITTHSMVVGDREYLTIETDLKPFWEPAADWDDVDEADRQGLVSEAEKEIRESAFHAKYHPSGAQFNESDNRTIGRLWGIDPAGELRPSDYERVSPPFDDYAPFTFDSLQTEGSSMPQDQVRRRRRMLPVSAKDGRGESMGVACWISMDSGLTWHPIRQRIFRAETEICAIYLTLPNLLELGKDIHEADSSLPAHYYDAYLQGAFRVRAAFNIDSDARVTGEASTLGAFISGAAPSRMVVAPKDFHREDPTRQAGGAFAALGGGVDDRDTARRAAQSVLRRSLDARIDGNPIIPWHETTRFGLGTPVLGIRRSEAGEDEISFKMNTGSEDRYPHIVGKVLRQTNGPSTELVLEDFSLRPALETPA